HKNSQLTQIALQLTHKNDMMVKIKNKLNHQHKSVEDEALKLALHEINEIIENEFEIQKEWERFENHFNDVHGDFYKKLKDRYPDLSLSYLKLCAYLKLDLSTKEIASLMNISLRGVEKARSRLRKKFELERSENLNQFI
ncbi:MAG: sigma-70 region 4 domain-containing protein, partial [Bacteroidales bacterium]|nr:sigma-70 region 4 domain-containing protein [Bacteroidales bacterium]